MACWLDVNEGVAAVHRQHADRAVEGRIVILGALYVARGRHVSGVGVERGIVQVLERADVREMRRQRLGEEMLNHVFLVEQVAEVAHDDWRLERFGRRGAHARAIEPCRALAHLILGCIRVAASAGGAHFARRHPFQLRVSQRIHAAVAAAAAQPQQRGTPKHRGPPRLCRLRVRDSPPATRCGAAHVHVHDLGKTQRTPRWLNATHF